MKNYQSNHTLIRSTIVFNNMNTPIRTAKEQFDRQASHYDAQWNSWSEETLNWLVDNSDASSTDRALDVATGSGFTALALSPKVKQVVGLDVSTGMLSEAHKRMEASGLANVTFVEGPAEHLPFPNGSFEIVTCRIAAHHFTNIDAFAAEAYRVLTPGGRLLIADTSVPDDDFLAAIWQNEVERIRDLSHEKNYSIHEWRRILDRPGFDIAFITNSGAGICIPLSEWIFRAGCTLEQGSEVRKRFVEAPANVRRSFKIQTDDGIENFTWLRVLIKAVRPE